jgi:cytochrome P450
MLEPVTSGVPFYPPHVKPSATPLRFPSNLIKLLSNNLEVIPEQAYREPLAIVPGPPRMAFFTGTELVENLLLTRPAEFPKGKLQVNVLKPSIGNALLLSEGREWRWQRGATAPLFRHEELLRYAPMMSAAAETTVAAWRSAPSGSIHRIDKDMMRAAFQVISDTMLAGGAEDVLRDIEVGHSDYYRGVNWWLMYIMLGLPHWLPRPGGKSMRAHETRLRRAVTELARAASSTAANGDDLIARLSRSRDAETGNVMSEERLVDNIVGFLIAGYDTTAFSLTWTIYLISQSPEWEARMLREIDDVVGAETVTSAHVAHLKTVQQVLNESLRLFPTAPVIVREIVNDFEFEGATIPTGTIGIIPIYAIHRHRSYWEDPDRFDPGRFASEGRPKPSRFQFMPFGAGPRICIGAAFAMIEATIMLATLIRAAHFEVDAGFDPQPCGRMFLVPKNGMPMRITLRESAAHAK